MPSAGAVCVPTITPLRVPYSGQTSNQIDTNTLIEIKSATRNAGIYFSTNGSKPDPFARKDKNTIKYKGPFLLNHGKRTIKAIAVSGDGRSESHVNSKTFIVDWVSPDHDENQEDDDQSFIMDSRRPQRSLHNSLNSSGPYETIQTNGNMALARSSMPTQGSMPYNGWVGSSQQPQTTLNQNPDYFFHYHMHQTSPRQASMRQSVGSGPAMVQPPVVVDAMSGYNNQEAWRPVSVPLPAVLNQSTATQTVGLFYPTHEQATRSPQDVEAVRQVREQITTGTGTGMGPAQEKPRLTDISPGKGYWKRQIAHIAAHLEAFSQKDAEFRAGVGKPKMGKMTYASIEDDGVDVTVTISLESRGSTPPVRGNRAQVARQDAINAKSKSESDSPYGATTRKKKPLTKRLAAKKKVEDDRLTPEEKQLIRELGPRGEGNIDVVQDMLDEGADPNCETKDGVPAIVHAAMNNQVESIPLLADAGAEINRKTPARKGNTALHEAVLLGPDGQEAIEALLDSGANPKVQNNKGDMPYDLAVANGYSSIVALFTSSMGQDMLKKMTHSKKDKGKKGRKKETESEDESEEEEKPRRKSKKYKEKLPKDKGTVVPVSKFNPENDAEKLRKAMKGLGTDEQAIIDVLANRSNDQRQKIAKQFKQMFGKDLLKELKSELSGKLLDVVQGLMMTPPQYDAYQLNKAVKGLGTNEEILIEVLCTRTNSSIEAIKNVYEDAYGEELEEAIAEDTSGHFERLLISVLQGSRPEGDEVDPDKAKADAEALYKAGEAKWGTDESRFNVIMMSRSYAQLRATFEEYGKLGKHDIEQAIKREMSGDLKEAMLTVVRCVRNKHKYFSDKLYKTMKGAGTDDDTLKRIIISRAEVDMLNIKGEFQSAYSQSLGQFVADDTSGDYKKILVALVGGTN